MMITYLKYGLLAHLSLHLLMNTLKESIHQILQGIRRISAGMVQDPAINNGRPSITVPCRFPLMDAPDLPCKKAPLRI